MPPNPEKELRIIEHQLVLDEQNRVRMPQALLNQLKVSAGDMLTIIFDDKGARVEGRKKPPYFHTNVRNGESKPRESDFLNPSSLTQNPLFEE